MKLHELYADPNPGGGYPEKKVKDKTKFVSKMLRKKADRNNPNRKDTSDIKDKKETNTDNDEEKYYNIFGP